jgi:hypothetical protein
MPTISRDDLRRVLGELDDPKVADILALDPSLAELEEAMVAASGDEEVLARRGRGLSPRAARIAEILTADEDDTSGPLGQPPRQNH